MRSASFDELRSSGRLVLLRQPGVRDDLAEYYAYDDLLTEVLKEPYGSFRRILMGALPGGIWEAYRRTPGDVKAQELEQGLRALVAHPDFDGAVNAELSYASAQMRWQIELKDLAIELLAGLAAAYPET